MVFMSINAFFLDFITEMAIQDYVVMDAADKYLLVRLYFLIINKSWQKQECFSIATPLYMSSSFVFLS